MSIVFALWCVGSGLYTGFLLVRRGLNQFRKVTNKIQTLNANLKAVNVTDVPEVKVVHVASDPVEVKENV